MTDLFNAASTGLLAATGTDIELDGGVASPHDPAGGVALGRDLPGVTIMSPCSSDSRFKLSNKETGPEAGDAAGRGERLPVGVVPAKRDPVAVPANRRPH